MSQNYCITASPPPLHPQNTHTHTHPYQVDPWLTVEEKRGDEGRSEERSSIFTWLYHHINIQLRKLEPFFTVTEEVVEMELRAFKSSMNFRKTTRSWRKGHHYWKTKNADGCNVCSDFNIWPCVGVCELSFSLA